jgi:hypothetical protein
MSCDRVREQLPDFVLASLPEVEMAAMRRHLRGCSTCRQDAANLDEGLAMFASAAHAMTPPPELEERVMAVLGEEWAEAPAPREPFARRVLRWPAMAAALVILAGALAWAGFAQSRASAFHQDAASYQHLLHALGGREVRVGVLHPVTPAAIDGTAVLYDSDRGQSWALVLVHAPGYNGELDVTLSAPSGQSITLRPIQIDSDGEGSTWLVSSSNLSRFRSVKLTTATGRRLATGTAASEH